MSRSRCRATPSAPTCPRARRPRRSSRRTCRRRWSTRSGCRPVAPAGPFSATRPAATARPSYYTALQDSTPESLYGGSTAFRDENNLDWRLKHLPAPPVSVLVTSSLVGEHDLARTHAVLRLVHSPMRGHSLLVKQGGHNYRTWVRQLPQSLEWLNQRLTPAVAPAQQAP